MAKGETTGKLSRLSSFAPLIYRAYMKQWPVAMLSNVRLCVSIGRGGARVFCFRYKENGDWKTLNLGSGFDCLLPGAMVRRFMIEAQTGDADLTA